MNDTAAAQARLGASEARAIARDAYVYGFPLVDAYRIQHAYFVDRSGPEYKAGWNVLCNIPRVYTPEDKAVQTPNSDTPYSMLGADLRAEPLVLTVPPIDATRYFSIQMIDAYTHNFDYIGSRSTGNGGGNYLVAGPGWNGAVPPGIDKVFRSETDIMLLIYRTQLFNPSELDQVKAIQAGYKVRPLSALLGQPEASAAAIEFMEPLTPAEQKTSARFFEVLDFVLGFCPVHPTETELRARFARLGIGTGGFKASRLSPELAAAVADGMTDAWKDMAGLKARVESHEVSSGDVFGTREYLKNNYLYRMAAAVLGIFGNSKQEAMYPMYGTDADGKPLDGNNNYVLRFPPGKLPPVNAFWSLTMYEMPSSLLVANPINRYLVNSPMLPELVRDADGGLSLLIQKASPGAGREANWLPAPAGPFLAVLRLYWPKPDAVDGSWTPPPVTRA